MYPMGHKYKKNLISTTIHGGEPNEPQTLNHSTPRHQVESSIEFP